MPLNQKIHTSRDTLMTNQLRRQFIQGSVVQAGYQSYVGIEYEGEHLSEDLGIKATQALLKKVHTQLADEKFNI